MRQRTLLLFVLTEQIAIIAIALIESPMDKM